MDKKFLETKVVGYNAGLNSQVKAEKLFRIWEFNADGVLIGMSEYGYKDNNLFHDKIRKFSQDGITVLVELKTPEVKGQSTRYMLVDDMKIVCLIRYGKDGFPDLVDFFDVTDKDQFRNLSERLMSCGKDGYPLI